MVYYILGFSSILFYPLRPTRFRERDAEENEMPRKTRCRGKRDARIDDGGNRATTVGGEWSSQSMVGSKCRE